MTTSPRILTAAVSLFAASHLPAGHLLPCAITGSPAIIPEPAALAFTEGRGVTLPADITVAFAPEFSAEAGSLMSTLRQVAGVRNVKQAPSERVTVFSMNIDRTLPSEGYTISTGETGVVIRAADRPGAFYAVQTLAQLARIKGAAGSLPVVEIRDRPRFEFRALMIDPARHFWKPEDIRRYVDFMAQYKFNKLHLHLSDDQGWRLAIPKWPKLAAIASARRETDGDGKPHGGVYTRDELRDIVAYAAARHIEVIPEIDVPGHNAALLAAYPEFACFPRKDFTVRTTPGVSKELLCPANEKLYALYADIYAELAAIFPSKLWHLGGDEAPLDRWKECPSCRALRDKHGLKSAAEEMSWFFHRMAGLATRHGKTPLFWHEDDVPDYPKNAVMYSWRMGKTPATIDITRKHGGKLVVAPGEFAYFDYPQVRGGHPRTPSASWMHVTSLRRVYEFDPGYGLPPERSSHIIGVEATLWGEEIRSVDRAFHMTWPRAWALAEAGWSPMAVRDWSKFAAKLPAHAEHADSQNIGIGPLPETSSR